MDQNRAAPVAGYACKTQSLKLSSCPVGYILPTRLDRELVRDAHHAFDLTRQLEGP